MHTHGIHGGVWQGYAQSKWICEQIVFRGAADNSAQGVVSERARQYRGFVHRFGSLANDADMVAVLSASIVIGALPSGLKTVEWLDIKMLSAELVSCVARELRSAHDKPGEPSSAYESVRHYSCRCDPASICQEVAQTSEMPELQRISTMEWRGKIQQAFFKVPANPQREHEHDQLHLKQENLKQQHRPYSLVPLCQSVQERILSLISVNSGLEGAIGLCERPLQSGTIDKGPYS